MDREKMEEWNTKTDDVGFNGLDNDRYGKGKGVA